MLLKDCILKDWSVGEYAAVPTGLRRGRGVDLSRAREDHRGLHRDRSGHQDLAKISKRISQSVPRIPGRSDNF